MNWQNLALFRDTYKKHLAEQVTNNPDYAYVKQQWAEGKGNCHTLVDKMVKGLAQGTASKDGDAVKLTCKELGIKHTYKAINEFFDTVKL